MKIHMCYFCLRACVIKNIIFYSHCIYHYFNLKIILCFQCMVLSRVWTILFINVVNKISHLNVSFLYIVLSHVWTIYIHKGRHEYKFPMYGVIACVNIYIHKSHEYNIISDHIFIIYECHCVCSCVMYCWDL